VILGETVVVERREETGRDPGNNPTYEWAPETVRNVLVAPGSRTDVSDSTRPDGTDVRFTLHFPKGYPATLRGARVSVRGLEPMNVIGDPQHYTEANTPGEWSMPCEIGWVEG
jgi:hypothetical protein